MHRSKLGPRQWAIAIHLFMTSSKGIAATVLARWLGVCYATAWYVGHRLRAMMQQAGPLAGVVEIDDCYLGGVLRQAGRGPGRALIVTAAERGGPVRMESAPTHSRAGLVGVARTMLGPVDHLYTDALPAYRALGGIAAHEAVTHSAGEFARGEAHVNTAESAHALLKRAVLGVYHWVSAKHAGRYAAEAAWHLSRRKDPDRGLSRLGGRPLGYHHLVAA